MPTKLPKCSYASGLIFEDFFLLTSKWHTDFGYSFWWDSSIKVGFLEGEGGGVVVVIVFQVSI